MPITQHSLDSAYTVKSVRIEAFGIVSIDERQQYIQAQYKPPIWQRQPNTGAADSPAYMKKVISSTIANVA